MATWQIEPTWKKSIIETIHFYKDNKSIAVETGWRWGEFTCETEDDTPPNIVAGTDLYNCDYDVELLSCDDGCWTEYEFEGLTEEEEENMRYWLDENSFFDLEETGWTCGDTEMVIDCEPSIVKIED